MSASKKLYVGSDWVAQLFRALSPCAKVVGSILGQGAYENQSMNA